jgi:hypothetical protein
MQELVSSLQFANTSALQNQNRRWTQHAGVASIVSTSPQARNSPELPACSHTQVLSQETGLAPLPDRRDSMGHSFERPRHPFRRCQVLEASPTSSKRVYCPRQIASRIYSDAQMDNVLRLPCRARWASYHHVWTFAQNTALASARLSTQDPLPEPRVGRSASES